MSKYDGFKCPSCGFLLDGVSRETCPRCERELKAEDIFKKRKYPGTIVLPGWIKTYSVPFVLFIIVAGVFMLYPDRTTWRLFALPVGALIIAVLAGEDAWDWR